MLSTFFRSILFWLLVASALAAFWPVEQVGFDPFGSTPPMLWAAIVITMFSLGALVKPEELLPLRGSPWWVALGVGLQVTVMPTIAWLTTQVIPMDRETALGVLLVGCVPGAMASNILTHAAGGSVAYSVSLTSMATLLSPLTVPGVLWLFARQETEDSLVFTSVLLASLVAFPTLAGYLIAQQRRAVHFFFARRGSFIASFALLWIVSVVVAAHRKNLMSVGIVLLLALLLINVIGYSSGYVAAKIARLPTRYRRALTLEIGMQNAGLGTTLSITLLGQHTIAAIPTAAYTFGCMLTGVLLVMLWQYRDRLTARTD